MPIFADADVTIRIHITRTVADVDARRAPPAGTIIHATATTAGFTTRVNVARTVVVDADARRDPPVGIVVCIITTDVAIIMHPTCIGQIISNTEAKSIRRVILIKNKGRESFHLTP